MKLLITNKTTYDTKEVSSLARFASRVVYKVAQEQQWHHRLDQYPIHIMMRDARYCYSGRAYGSKYVCNVKGAGTLPLPPMAVVWDVRVRVGPPTVFPVQDATDRRYKDMPKASVLTWQEAVVMLVAHELGHCKWPGGREGEHRCDLLGVQAINAHRRASAAVEREPALLEQRELQREMCMA